MELGDAAELRLEVEMGGAAELRDAVVLGEAAELRVVLRWSWARWQGCATWQRRVVAECDVGWRARP